MNWQEFPQNKPKKSGFYAIIHGSENKQLSLAYYQEITGHFLYPIDNFVCDEYKDVLYWRTIDDFPCKDELIQGFKK